MRFKGLWGALGGFWCYIVLLIRLPYVQPVGFELRASTCLQPAMPDRRWAIDFGDDPLRCALIGVESWTLNGNLGVLDPERQPWTLSEVRVHTGSYLLKCFSASLILTVYHHCRSIRLHIPRSATAVHIPHHASRLLRLTPP